MRGVSDGAPAPGFDETKHAGICTEVLPLFLFIYFSIAAAEVRE